MKVANGDVITPTSQAKIQILSELSDEAQHVFMFNDLATESLLSIGQLCNDDCIVLFSKYLLKILKNKKVIIEGKRNNKGLWDVLLHHPRTKPQTPTLPTQIPMANGIIRKFRQRKSSHSTYLHHYLDWLI